MASFVADGRWHWWGVLSFGYQVFQFQFILSKKQDVLILDLGISKILLSCPQSMQLPSNANYAEASLDRVTEILWPTRRGSSPITSETFYPS